METYSGPEDQRQHISQNVVLSPKPPSLAHTFEAVCERHSSYHLVWKRAAKLHLKYDTAPDLSRN